MLQNKNQIESIVCGVQLLRNEQTVRYCGVYSRSFARCLLQVDVLRCTIFSIEDAGDKCEK
jgi:hypothetical protein